MKKILFISALVLVLFNFNIQANANVKDYSFGKYSNSSLVSKFFKRIDKTYHSTNGYTIRIVGNLNHNAFFTSWSFSGKVYITGNGINIVLTLELTEPSPLYNAGAIKFDEYASVNISGNGTSATSAIWDTGNQIAYDVLNSQEIVDAFLVDVNYETFN